MPETLTYAQAFAEGLKEEMTRDDSIFVLGTDLFGRGGNFAQVKGLGEAFGRERIRDTPISEAAIVAAGVGAALNGMHPVVDLAYIDFAFSAMDEIANQAAKIRYMLRVPMPLVIRGTMGVAAQAAQHNNAIEAWFAHMPGLLVATPATPFDNKALIKTALRLEDPVVFLMHKRLGGLRGEVGGPDDLIPFGRGSIVRNGSHVTVVAYSIMVGRALEAADNLAAEGIDVEVIDLRTLMPVDFELVEESVMRTGKVVVAGEEPKHFGVVSEVAASIQEAVFDYLDKPVLRVGAAHSPIPHSPALIDAIVPQARDVENAVRLVMAE